ncbi:MAG: M48 family metalloprotease [Chloroflexota bacterium]|nr:M48 family metalloprotease [Anaerolineae bacterium]
MRLSASPYGYSSQQGGGSSIRLILGVVIAIISIISYVASRSVNPVTGENQYLSLTPDQEIALGLQSAPEMIQEFGGLSTDQNAQNTVDNIGMNIVNKSVAHTTPWQFNYNVLADQQTVNAFALPGGQVFITEALLSQLTTQDEIAGVLSHETIHVLARHSAQQIASSDLTNGLIGAVGVASGDANTAQTAAVIGQLIGLKYSRDDETQADTLGVCLMIASGYNPQGMVEVMQVLQTASGGSSQPEFLETHPNPANRITQIQNAIQNAPSNCGSYRG